MLAIGSEEGINVFDYFTALQQDKEKVKNHPANYLPACRGMTSTI
jgi:hypothetical protein